jgi:hypothetical protein
MWGQQKMLKSVFMNTIRESQPQTRAGMPWELIHTECFATRSEAMMQERKIKARGIGRYLSDIKPISPG